MTITGSAETGAAAGEFQLARGVWLSILSGIMSACMAFGIRYGEPIAKAAVAAGATELCKNVPMFIVLLFGGFSSNLVLCMTLSLRNRTAGQFA